MQMMETIVYIEQKFLFIVKVNWEKTQELLFIALPVTCDKESSEEETE
jgi:hypothetical protein